MAYNILIVDDSETMRAVLKRTIQMTGVPVEEIYQAENGRAALNLLDEKWVDIVFADINMPVMNGLEMVDSMVNKGQIYSTPVVIVSTEGSRVRLDELTSKGVKAFLRKPVTPEKFEKVVCDVLED
ncbi:MAG: response regulator [Chitinispirillaceae bacterium]